MSLRLRAFAILVVTALCGTTALSGQAMPQARIRQQPDANLRVTLPDSVSVRLRTAQDLGVARPMLTDMMLLLKRTDAQTRALDTLLQAQQDASSPQFHHWLTPEEFGQQFGAAQTDIDQLTTWLGSRGFTVKSVSPSRVSITFSGSADQVASTFGAEMHSFHSPSGETFFANASPVQIPAAFSEVVSAVAGLNSFRAVAMHRNAGLVRRDSKTGEVQALGKSMLKPNLSSGTGGTANFTNTQAPRHLVSPGDFATIYNLKPALASGLDGTGQSIAIVAKSDVSDSDVQAFHSIFSLPAPKLTRYVVNSYPGFSGSEGEADLDVQWSSAVARNVTVNLVLASDTATTDGVTLAAQYIVDHNLSPVVSVSWGLCELFEGSENQLISQIWQQAAAQGQSVAVATGDSGSPLCNAGETYSTYGLAVNALASSPNVVAVGGTDLYGSYTSPNTYWNTTNATDFSSAKSYIPEVPWNDTCANPLVLEALHTLGATDTTTEALCNNPSYSNWLLVVGGSGGRSTCTSSMYASDYDFTCLGGYAKPTWQSGTFGMPADGSRDLPDVSLFAGDGLWGSAYVYCQSDISSTGTCDYTNPADVTYMAAGGTSFATPEFAGVLAMIVQQQGGRIGNPNPTLYNLGNTQFADPARSQACTAENASVGNSCVFYDITQSNNAAPCAGGSADCFIGDPANSYGIVTGWSSNAGYDMTSGLGTLNISNLISAWPTVKLSTVPTTATFALNQTSATYGATLTGTVTVTSASGVPTGSVAVVTDNYGTGAFTLVQGVAAATLSGLSGGTHAITATYPGEVPFLASTSAPITVTIAKAPTTLAVTSNRTSLTGATSYTLMATITTSQSLSSPTGTVTVTDQTNGVALGTFPVSASNSGANLGASAVATLSGANLASGANHLILTYSGDTNFSGSSSTSLTITQTPQFSLSFGQGSFTLPANGSSTIPITITTSGPLPANVLLSCPAGLPSFLSCSFSPTLIPAGSTTMQSTLTVYAAPLAAQVSTPVRQGSGPVRYAVVALLLLLPFGVRGRRLQNATLSILLGCTVFLSGCSTPVSIAAPALSLAASQTSVPYHSAVVLTATLSGTQGSTQAAVVFTEGATELGRGMVSNGAATFSTSSLSAGSHTITAAYSGDSNNKIAYSAPVTVDVTYSFKLSVQASDALGNTASASVPAVVQ